MSISHLTDYFEPWPAYRHPVVRQLAFALASPNILLKLPPTLEIQHTFELHDNDFWQQHYHNYQPRLIALDRDPQPLLDFLQQLKSTRLGLRFEMLMWFWLLDREYHPYELIGHSIQKIEGSRTLGELDFVLLNSETKTVEHWEVALKYYLAEHDFSLPHWYGLNRSDTLQRKLKHFTEKQFQFKDAQQHCIQRRYAVMKGQLYFPQTTRSTAQQSPTWVNDARRHGVWGHHIPAVQEGFYRLQRHEWICAERQATSEIAQWWTDGLYRSAQEQYYMFRQRPLLTTLKNQELSFIGRL